MIIDAHVHLPVVDGCISLQQKKESVLLEMTKNQVSKCIVISDSDITSPIGTVDECVKLFKDTENAYVVGGISPFFNYEKQLKKLEGYLEQEMIIGIKLFTGHEMFYLTDNRISEVYDLAIRYDVPVLFHSGWDNSQYSAASVVAKVAEEYLELKLVCCHCFYPNICDCQELIRYSNVYFDISSIADDLIILGKVESEIKKLIQMIPTRVLFGSDYAGCNQMHHIEMVRSLGLDKRTEELVFEKNATRLYSLN